MVFIFPEMTVLHVFDFSFVLQILIVINLYISAYNGSYIHNDQCSPCVREIVSENNCPDNSACSTPPQVEGTFVSTAANDEQMALVVYTPTHLSAFRQDTKTFEFAGRSVTIRQRWEELGVAAVVWDAAVVLAEYLESSVNAQQLAIDGKSVIELGAGTGLAGIVAALLGGNVVLTDRKVALDQLQANVEENSPKSSGRSGTISVQELSWGENLQEFLKPFEIIIGADIVYVEDTFPKLLQTIAHLSDRDTLVLLSCRIRYARDERFLDMMRHQFSMAEVLHDKRRDIHLYEARLL
ncbi:protein N-lysine methyltransferase METTL21A-like [Acanthaster planci]|uniref:Protein N-lysine methyltransferase METTL21A-like n=1 Tax=Acanthaster planci TaxID=133434 RepID=A0A8B7ZJ04_ACAPL|nr:protein N-lysine methyltransferase METTL21A-like [Acanthaster planci]